MNAQQTTLNGFVELTKYMAVMTFIFAIIVIILFIPTLLAESENPKIARFGEIIGKIVYRIVFLLVLFFFMMLSPL